MRAKPLVSVIIPCYNYAHFLGEALDSVMVQTYQHWECIIINDGSPDNTEEVALTYCEKDSRIKYFYKENGGHSSARNFGIRNSVGKYILPLDPDDKIAELYIEKAVEIMEKSPEVKVVAGYTQLFGTSNKMLKLPEYNFRSLLISNFLYNSCLYRRSEYNKTNGYDENMLGFEDWNLWICILKDGGTVYELPFTCYYYRKKENSVYQNLSKDRVFKDLVRLYNNQIASYKNFFSSPIELIQENEKLTKTINNYQKTRSYKLGYRIHNFKNLFKKQFKKLRLLTDLNF